MARIVDWYHPYTNKKENKRTIFFWLLLFGAFLGAYYIPHINADLAIFILFVSLFMILIGTIFNRKYRSAGALFIVGAILMYGMGISSYENHYLTLFTFLLIASLMTSLVLLEKWVSKTQERMKVYVEGNYSMKLIKKLDKEIENMLEYKGYPYKHYGLSFQMDFEDKERIIVALRTMKVENETEYKFILRTNRARNNIRFMDIKKGVDKLIFDYDQNNYFDSYPQIEKMICNHCGNNAYYNSGVGKIYCSKCTEYRNEDETRIYEIVQI